MKKSAGPGNHPDVSVVLRKIANKRESDSIIIHEIRNPLANINMSVYLLKKNSDLDSREKYLDVILRNSQNIGKMVDSMLTKEKETLHKEKNSVNRMMDDVLELNKDSLDMNNITVTRQYDTMDYMARFNKAQMYIALTNIVINAVHSFKSQTGHLHVVTRHSNDSYILQIKDNGCGIKKNDLKRIFTAYYTTKPFGTGLGLSATRNILESNEVEVVVTSKVGLGSTFTLSFRRPDSVE